MGTIEKVIQDYECAVGKLILYCVAELPFPLGIRKTISLLKGSKSTFVIDKELYRLATYSILSTFTCKQLRAIIEALAKADFLEIRFVGQYENMPVLKITAKGRDVIADKSEANIKFVEHFVDRDIPEFDEGEKALFAELRKLRRQIAHQRDIPSFMICGDTTLRELVRQKPLDNRSLLSVRGIGEKFCQNYGEKFVEIIRSHFPLSQGP